MCGFFTKKNFWLKFLYSVSIRYCEIIGKMIRVGIFILSVLYLSYGTGVAAEEYEPAADLSYPVINRGNGDSITEVRVRDYTKNGKFIGSRTEFIKAVITRDTYQTVRGDRNFNANQKTHMENFLQGETDDEAGHLVAASLGGTSDLYNLAPQHKLINRNVGTRNNVRTLADPWKPVEDVIRKYVKDKDHLNRKVEYTVDLRYNSLDSRRPSMFLTEAKFYDNNVLVDTVDGSNTNRLPHLGF